MKLECRQCGAAIAVTSPDAYVTCSYCGARSIVSGFTGQSFLHRPVLTEQDLLRQFPAGAVVSVSMYWFPYDPESFEKVFTQPYPEMESYRPPSGDRRIWNGSSQGETVIPVDPDLAGEHGVVFHPVWVAISGSSGQGTLVDGVSGRLIGQPQAGSLKESVNPVEESLRAFAAGVVPALVIFFVLKGLSLFWASVLGMAAAIAAPDLLDRIKRGRR